MFGKERQPQETEVEQKSSQIEELNLFIERMLPDCPIHQAIDVKKILRRSSAGELSKLLQAVILIRGQFPKIMSDEEKVLYQEYYHELINRYKIKPIVSWALNNSVNQIVEQWINQETPKNIKSKYSFLHDNN